MNTASGGFWVDFYNSSGERIAGASVWAESLEHAHGQADKCWPQGDGDRRGASYTVNRCLFNSLQTEPLRTDGPSPVGEAL